MQPPFSLTRRHRAILLTIGIAILGLMPPVIPSSRPTIPLWVFLRDRGFSGEGERAASLDLAFRNLTEASALRRARVGSPLVDDGDLPIAASYLRALAPYGAVRHESRWLNAVSIQTALDRIPEIAALSFVTGVRPVARGRPAYPVPLLPADDDAKQASPHAAPTDLPYGQSWEQLFSIGVVGAHNLGFSGNRVSLMMIDTGYRKTHLAFEQTRLIAERDFIEHDGDTSNGRNDTPEQDDHGTATWSTAAGYFPDKLIGPAYGADLYLAKTESVTEEMPWEEDAYIAALEWADSLGVTYTSASLAYLGFGDGSGWAYRDLDGDTTPLTRALDRAASRGMLCANAMGNSGPEFRTLNVPADADSILAVGAVQVRGGIASFSSRGPTADGRIKPEVVAPGVNVWCASTQSDRAATQLSGTSLATPLVGGACALVQEAHPEWNAMDVRFALIRSGHTYFIPDNIYGHGRINVMDAITLIPMVVPLPFSLVSPVSGDSIDAVAATFSWKPAEDPQGSPVTYELWLDDDPEFGSPIQVTEIPDTVVTVTEILPALTELRWRVYAEDVEGYRRLSREDWSCMTRALPDTVTPPPATEEGWKLVAASNPWKTASMLRWNAPAGSYGQQVEVSLFDAFGRRVFRDLLLVDQEGWNELDLAARDPGGRRLASGLYIAVLRAGASSVRTKVLLAR